ncbi:hypothetical protein HRR83_006361 [Exophiala dermatitidis]|uniref:Uncharacterized protein n=2 Tax=Exophiala dermatitidis TaxID=5970 RepID=H6CA36_EXODN|nr:uncharacterized protein HMPREF1120_07975 [Exophiala dermatitidis NIH/UT8656]KAJ4507375.1 hypothetical protein HRR75_006724 [Exophiala dermatitidis]EHY60000.1 hypothetical protein HMPREF1120_07975 [Exophiala dermatitidis NIH/UT8656]KAJ4509365.1 hypothetical protein HRR73_007219 [Exophiala dermatitidis]KAJ4509552.1 hypothetical protein HRR74_007333 [Exophiala dermatitidis]KAJ4530553.1 hypothetical protein HRR76_008261 [Exophiala dermatitidis]
MARHKLVRAWSKGSSTSGSSASTRRCHSSRSSHSQHTDITSYSDVEPHVKQYHEYEADEVVVEPCDYNDEQHDDPRASCVTYASTIASEEEPSKPPSLCPLPRQICYEPDAVGTTPSEFAELFPSSRRLLIQHDDTTLDGNLNLRVDTEMILSKGRKLKLTLFHLRMNNLGERQFSLRRYHRQSGREVCSSKRKYLKPSARPSSQRGKNLGGALNIVSLKTLAAKRKPTRAHHEYEQEQEESDDDLDLFTAQAGVKATIPTDTIRIEFSNYAQVELQRSRRGDGKLYDFEYWGEKYTWRRNVFQDESELVFTFELVNRTTGVCLAHITPDRLSPRQSKLEAAQGGWVPPCSMRIAEKNISSDLGDVIVATGLIALTDDCIRQYWHETHRH